MSHDPENKACPQYLRPGLDPAPCRHRLLTCAECDPCTCPAPKPQGTPRLCPGCRSPDGEHDFGPTCTVTEHPTFDD